MKARDLLAGLLLTTAIPGAAATAAYNISNAPEIDCDNAPYDLWKNPTSASTCANYFDISDVLIDEAGFSSAEWITPDQQAGNGWDLSLILAQQIPEPGSLALLGAGILAFGAHQLRRRS